jgi:hypothetical protein
MLIETADVDLRPHLLPADMFDQMMQDHFKCDAVERVGGHERSMRGVRIEDNGRRVEWLLGAFAER